MREDTFKRKLVHLKDQEALSLFLLFFA